MLSKVRESFTQVSSLFVAKMEPIVAYMRPVATNIFTALYHTGSAVGHFGGGIIDAAYKLFLGFSAILLFSVPAVVTALTLAFKAVKAGTYAAGKSLMKAFRSLRGLDEEDLVETQIVETPSFSYTLFTEEEIELFNNNGTKISDAFSKVFHAEREHVKTGVFDSEREQLIQDNLYNIYTSVRDVVLFFGNKFRQENNSTVTIEDVSQLEVTTEARTSNRLLNNNI